jgi:hypothetical protein
VGQIPFRELLAALLEHELRPERFRKKIESLLSGTDAWHRGDITLDRFVAGDYLFSDDVLFPRNGLGRWLFALYSRRASSHSRPIGTFDVARDIVPELASLFGIGVCSSESRERLRELISPSLADAIPEDASKRRWPPISSPGVYRREHACIAIRSRSTTIVLDPIALEPTLPGLQLCPGNDGSSSPDAVLITHSHGDHWHLPSIFACAGPKPRVIVPYVPRANVLCPTRFVNELKACGARAIAAKWWTTLVIGDMEIDVLPFYGEQPTRRPPSPPDGVRSWGNCYRITTADFSVAVIVDGGTDPAGSMAEVMALSCAKRGPLDLLLSCTRDFASPFFDGLPHFWSCLPLRQLRGLYALSRDGRLPATVAGLDGLVEICAAARARYFAPYAQGFFGLRAAIADIDWGDGHGPSEKSQAVTLHKRLGERQVATKILRWNPGDAVRFSRGSARVIGQ